MVTTKFYYAFFCGSLFMVDAQMLISLLTWFELRLQDYHPQFERYSSAKIAENYLKNNQHFGEIGKVSKKEEETEDIFRLIFFQCNFFRRFKAKHSFGFDDFVISFDGFWLSLYNDMCEGTYFSTVITFIAHYYPVNLSDYFI